ncbi:Exodeoxyribonuclease 7 large subunit [Phycisphaerae bacterium RAS1]|nr:Exodeoxyribonuclease 7 large subunit [Phycisphaerae bacterium RAS1]
MAQRPLFDPSRIRPPDEPPAPPALGLVSVRDVNEMIRGAVSKHLPATLHVLGEIGDLSRPASGHLYFTLKDAASELRCVMWRSSAASLKFRPEVGMQVIATGGIDVYTPRGTYQLVARKLEPRGVGALEVAFRQLKERLAAEGLFDPARKRPLPRVPRRIAVITSPRGAAIADILRTIERRFPALHVLVFPVPVQGEEAGPKIAAAIRFMNDQAEALGGIDAAIVGRGGGSLEDLWAFNEEIVARAIFASRVPIVSAVGHEVDFSISDFVADVRAATPTAAAELVTPRRDELLEYVAARLARTVRQLRHAFDTSRMRFDALLAASPLADPLAVVREQRRRIDEHLRTLRIACGERFADAFRTLHKGQTRLVHIGAGRTFGPAQQRLNALLARLQRGGSRYFLNQERRLVAKLSRIQEAGPPRRLARLHEHLAPVGTRLANALITRIRAQRELLDSRAQAVAAMHPVQTLKRGYSLARDAKTGRLIRSVAEIRDGQRLHIEVGDGEFPATAEDPRQPRLFDR